MAQETSPKPEDPVPDNSASPDSDSVSDGQDSIPDSAVPADIDNLLAQASNSLTDLDDQLTSPAELDPVPSATSGSRTEEIPLDSTPEQEPSVQPDQIDNTLNDLEQDMQALNQQVNAPPAVPPKEDVSPQENLDSSEDQENTTTDSADPEPALPSSTSAAEESEAVIPDDPVAVEDIDDVLSAIADEMQGVTQDELESTEDTPPAASAELETTAEDEQVADDEIDTIIAQTEQDLEEAAPEPADQPQAEQSAPADEDTAEASIPDPVPVSTELPPSELASQTDSDSHEEAPAEQPQVDTVQEEIEDFTTDPKAKDDFETNNQLQETETSAEDADEIPSEGIAAFSLPLRLFIKAMVGFNKPFGFVPEKVKDLLGIAAVITVLLSVLTTALILFMLD
jgi:pilus assembly protein FimV